MADEPQSPSELERKPAPRRKVEGVGWKVCDFSYFSHPHEGLAAAVYAIGSIVAAGLLVLGCIAVWSALTTLYGGLAVSALGFDAARNLLLGIGAVVASPFVVWRTFIAHNQWLVSHQQARTQTETLQTSLLTKAIEQLGAMREEKRSFQDAEGKWQTVSETVPNLEVRLGAIYLLRRLAEDNARDHWPILETLCAYIRENSREEWRKWSRQQIAKGRVPEEGENPEYLEPVKKNRLRVYPQNARAIALRSIPGLTAAIPTPREDISSALNVIGQRQLVERHNSINLLKNSEIRRLSLSNCFLPRSTLDGLNFNYIDCHHTHFELSSCTYSDFSTSNLQGSDFSFATCFKTIFSRSDCFEGKFYGAYLNAAEYVETDCGNADFSRSFCGNAIFLGAKCETAEFCSADASEANFTASKCSGANFFDTNLRGSLFSNENLHKADFTYSRVHGADFARTFFFEANVQGISSLTPIQLVDAKGIFTTDQNISHKKTIRWQTVSLLNVPDNELQTLGHAFEEERLSHISRAIAALAARHTK